MTSRPPPSARQASRKAADAADRPLDWLNQQGGLPDGAGDGQPEPGQLTVGSVAAPGSDPSMPPIPAKREAFAREDTAREFGEVPGQERDVGQNPIRHAERADDAARAPRHTDWLHHRVLVARACKIVGGWRGRGRVRVHGTRAGGWRS